tara:strand:+ start:11386 stop:11859 length:474 start_codon:yes stop_codon:yes gene_type:complete
MTDNKLQKNFKSDVKNLLNTLAKHADGENIIVGTKEDPIITNSDKLPIEHFFMDGVYVRKMTMYKDSAVVGAIHKHLHMCFLLSGHLTVSSEHGVVEYKAPCHVIATPGTQRVLYANEESVWYNVHKNITNTEDVKQIECDLVVLNQEEYEEYIKNK